MFILDISVSGASQASNSTNQNNPQIIQNAITLQRQLLSAMARGDSNQQQEIQARLDRLVQLNGSPIQLPQSVREQYQQSLTTLAEQAAPLRIQLLQAITRGDDRAISNIQLRLGRLDAIHNQTQRFLGVQNPTGVPLTQTERNKFQYGLTIFTEQILSLERQVEQAILSGNDRAAQEITARITNLKAILSQAQRFLGVQNPTGTQQ